MSHHQVDISRTWTTNISEMCSYFGIVNGAECLRQTLTRVLRSKPGCRHLKLISRFMTVDGEIKNLRVNGSKKQLPPMQKAVYEFATKQLIDACLNGEVDPGDTPVSAAFCHKEFAVGCGRVEIVTEACDGEAVNSSVTVSSSYEMLGKGYEMQFACVDVGTHTVFKMVWVVVWYENSKRMVRVYDCHSFDLEREWSSDEDDDNSSKRIVNGTRKRRKLDSQVVRNIVVQALQTRDYVGCDIPLGQMGGGEVGGSSSDRLTVIDCLVCDGVELLRANNNVQERISKLHNWLEARHFEKKENSQQRQQHGFIYGVAPAIQLHFGNGPQYRPLCMLPSVCSNLRGRGAVFVFQSGVLTNSPVPSNGLWLWCNNAMALSMRIVGNAQKVRGEYGWKLWLPNADGEYCSWVELLDMSGLLCEVEGTGDEDVAVRVACQYNSVFQQWVVVKVLNTLPGCMYFVTSPSDVDQCCPYRVAEMLDRHVRTRPRDDVVTYMTRH